MKAYWQKLANRYASLQPRERQLVAAAVLVAVGFVGFTLLVDPPRERARTLRQQIAQQQGEVANLQAQVTTLQSQRTDPDAANRSAMARTQTYLADTDDQLRRLDGSLVAPEQMGQLLRSVLARHRGLTLVSLRTLPPEPLIKHAPAEGEADVAPTRDNLYKHGLEIRVAGSYADLTGYVEELENSPQRLLWERLSLAVVRYPRNELTIRVYTLSRNADWLTV